ncbi:MAG: hypothetical protein ACXWO1_20265, partial [Isosphaeraceae bacterium]
VQHPDVAMQGARFHGLGVMDGFRGRHERDVSLGTTGRWRSPYRADDMGFPIPDRIWQMAEGKQQTGSDIRSLAASQWPLPLTR